MGRRTPKGQGGGHAERGAGPGEVVSRPEVADDTGGMGVGVEDRVGGHSKRHYWLAVK